MAKRFVPKFDNNELEIMRLLVLRELNNYWYLTNISPKDSLNANLINKIAKLEYIFSKLFGNKKEEDNFIKNKTYG